MFRHAKEPRGCQVRVVQHALQIIHGHVRNVGFLQQGQPCGCAALREDFCQLAVDQVDVARALRKLGKTGVCQQLSAAHGGQESCPLFVVVDQRAHKPVQRLVGPPVGRKMACVAAFVKPRLKG